MKEINSVKENNNQLKLDAICAAFKEGKLTYEEFTYELENLFLSLKLGEVKKLLLR